MISFAFDTRRSRPGIRIACSIAAANCTTLTLYLFLKLLPQHSLFVHCVNLKINCFCQIIRTLKATVLHFVNRSVHVTCHVTRTGPIITDTEGIPMTYSSAETCCFLFAKCSQAFSVSIVTTNRRPCYAEKCTGALACMVLLNAPTGVTNLFSSRMRYRKSVFARQNYFVFVFVANTKY